MTVVRATAVHTRLIAQLHNDFMESIGGKHIPMTAERVKELGGQVLNGPMEVPGGGLIAQCLDPQGALFAIHSVAQ